MTNQFRIWSAEVHLVGTKDFIINCLEWVLLFFPIINTSLFFCLAHKEIPNSSKFIEVPIHTSKFKVRKQWWTYHFCKDTECALCKAIKLLFNCTEPQPNVNSQLCRHFDVFRLVLWVLAHKQKCYSLLCCAGIIAFSNIYITTKRYESQ